MWWEMGVKLPSGDSKAWCHGSLGLFCSLDALSSFEGQRVGSETLSPSELTPAITLIR